MPVLALTTSGTRAQVGLIQQGRSQVLENSDRRQHSEWLHGAVSELLQNFGVATKDLSCVAVDIGPGSFTGLRVGFQLAQTLCYANQTPIFLATSCEILAAGLPGRILCASNAFRNLVYSAEYADGKVIQNPMVITAEDYSEQLKARLQQSQKLSFVGDAFDKMPALVDLKIQSVNRLPSAESLAQLALRAGPDLWTTDWKTKTPLYLRGSEAEEKAKIK